MDLIMLLSQIDSYVAKALVNIRHPFFIKLFAIITHLGSLKVIIFLSIIFAIFLSSKKYKSYILPFILSMGLTSILLYLTKIFFSRTRPPYALITELTPSFPSGHTAIAMAFYGFVAYFFWINIKNKINKIKICLPFLILIFLISFSRLYLGVHYLTDVIGGLCLGFFILASSIIISRHRI